MTGKVLLTNPVLLSFVISFSCLSFIAATLLLWFTLTNKFPLKQEKKERKKTTAKHYTPNPQAKLATNASWWKWQSTNSKPLFSTYHCSDDIFRILKESYNYLKIKNNPSVARTKIYDPFPKLQLCFPSR